MLQVAWVVWSRKSPDLVRHNSGGITAGLRACDWTVPRLMLFRRVFSSYREWIVLWLFWWRKLLRPVLFTVASDHSWSEEFKGLKMFWKSQKKKDVIKDKSSVMREQLTDMFYPCTCFLKPFPRKVGIKIEWPKRHVVVVVLAHHLRSFCIPYRFHFFFFPHTQAQIHWKMNVMSFYLGQINYLDF